MTKYVLAIAAIVVISATATEAKGTIFNNDAMSLVVAAELAAQPTKKYLNLGADPVNRNRQPIPGVEEVIILDEDVCDSGWGTGSGRRVAGCYPRHSAAIRNIETGYLTVMYVCGNDPRDKHRVSGKVVPSQLLPALGQQSDPFDFGKVFLELNGKIDVSGTIHHMLGVEVTHKLDAELMSLLRELVAAKRSAPTPTTVLVPVNKGRCSSKKCKIGGPVIAAIATGLAVKYWPRDGNHAGPDAEIGDEF